MKSNLVALSLVSLVLGAGCSLRAQSDGELGTTDQLLVADEQESTDSDDTLEVGVDEPLSGSDAAKPAEPGDALDERGRIERVRGGAAKHFQPEGCLTSSVEGRVVTHVFNNCTSLRGLKKLNGTVVSTWSFEPGKAKVVHAAMDFNIDGAVISGSRSVEYSKVGSVYTKHRVGSWSGATASGKPITHDADFVTSFDTSTGCAVRNGEASSSVGKREFSRKVEGLERCGQQFRGCPDAGKITIARAGRSLQIEFLGGRNAEVTLPSGSVVSKQMACVE